jgi:hypothetical protein
MEPECRRFALLVACELAGWLPGGRQLAGLHPPKMFQKEDDLPFFRSKTRMETDKELNKDLNKELNK